jgi:hypothetical protein
MPSAGEGPLGRRGQKIRDAAVAMAAYARQANNKSLYADADEVRWRAERRAGEMMAVQYVTVGKATGTRGQLAGRDASGGLLKNPPEDAPALAALAAAGIDKNLAHRIRSLERVSEEQFEQIIAAGRARIADEADRVKRHAINAINRAARRVGPHRLRLGHTRRVARG